MDEQAPNHGTLMAHCGAAKLSRAQLVNLPTPQATQSFKPIPHAALVDALLEALSFRHINVVNDEYAATPDGMKLFGILELETQFDGCRFALGIRNSNDKSMRLAMTVGYRVFACDNMAFSGDFTPVLAKHSKHFNLLDSLAIGIDRMQRNFEPMKKQVFSWREAQLSDEQAKLLIYKAFIETDDFPRHLGRYVHEYYFDPKVIEFASRTIWSLSNAFTSAFKLLDPIPQFKATGKLANFLNVETTR